MAIIGIGLGTSSSEAAALASPLVLHEPNRDSAHPLERALFERRSVRELSDVLLSLAEVSQLAWATQGLVSRSGHRTTPSAGALNPLELYLVAGNVRELAAGVYRYEPQEHRITRVAMGDCRSALAEAALGQAWLEDSAAILIIAADERRTTRKYGQRGVHYVHMEAGHSGQNALLQAVALGLAAAPVGALEDEAVRAVVGLPADEQPLYLIAVGRPR